MDKAVDGDGIIGGRINPSSMRASLMAWGAFLFVLGAAMIAVSPLTASYGLFSVAGTQLEAINTGLKLALVGLIVAPIGAAILAYGIGGTDPTWAEDETESATEAAGETTKSESPNVG